MPCPVLPSRLRRESPEWAGRGRFGLYGARDFPLLPAAPTSAPTGLAPVEPQIPHYPRPLPRRPPPGLPRWSLRFPTTPGCAHLDPCPASSCVSGSSMAYWRYATYSEDRSGGRGKERHASAKRQKHGTWPISGGRRMERYASAKWQTYGTRQSVMTAADEEGRHETPVEILER